MTWKAEWEATLTGMNHLVVSTRREKERRGEGSIGMSSWIIWRSSMVVEALYLRGSQKAGAITGLPCLGKSGTSMKV